MERVWINSVVSDIFSNIVGSYDFYNPPRPLISFQEKNWTTRCI